MFAWLLTQTNRIFLQIYAIWSYWIYQSHIDLFEDLSPYIDDTTQL